MQYEWKNPKTGQTMMTPSPDKPPKYGWVRVFTFGVGRVEGGGGSPGRVSQ